MEHSIKAGLTSSVIGAEETQEGQENTDGSRQEAAGKKAWKEIRGWLPEQRLPDGRYGTSRTAESNPPPARPAESRHMDPAGSHPYQNRADGHTAAVARAGKTNAYIGSAGKLDAHAGRAVQRAAERIPKQGTGAGDNMPAKWADTPAWSGKGTVSGARIPTGGTASMTGTSARRTAFTTGASARRTAFTTGASARRTASMTGVFSKGTTSTAGASSKRTASGALVKGTGQTAGALAKGTAAAASGAATAGASTVAAAASAAKRVAKRAADRAREALEASLAGKRPSGTERREGSHEDAAFDKSAGDKNAPGFVAGFFSSAIILVLFIMMSALLMLSLALHQKAEEQAKTEGGKHIVAVARQEAAESDDNIGGGKYKAWYGMDDNWCAMFVSWCADQCGYIASGTMPKTASVANMKAWYQQKGQYYAKESGYEPKAGDVILFGNGRSHTGLVVEYDPDTKTVTTIEGNTGTSATTPYHKGSRVKEKKYPLTYNTIAGYGTPEYPADEEESSEISETELKEEEVNDIADTN